MLILTMKPGDCIAIGDNVLIRHINQRGKQTRVGILAPKDVQIDHKYEKFNTAQRDMVAETSRVKSEREPDEEPAA